jgi:hypothetical protein
MQTASLSAKIKGKIIMSKTIIENEKFMIGTYAQGKNKNMGIQITPTNGDYIQLTTEKEFLTMIDTLISLYILHYVKPNIDKYPLIIKHQISSILQWIRGRVYD